MRDETTPFDPAAWREDYNWQEAFCYAKNIRISEGCPAEPFKMEDVAEVLKADPGMNDGPAWLMVGRLKDGRFFLLDAGCDYTGWDCQAGGDAAVADSLATLIRYGMTNEHRERLGYSLPSEG